MFYRNGIIYFVNMCSSNNKMYLPTDILNLIFNFCHEMNKLTCIICEKVLINFNINILHKNNDIENYSIINGKAKCDNCYCD